MDRSALVERLVAAIPARETPSRPHETPGGAVVRADLVQAHPDRVAEIDAAFSRMGACLDTEADRLTRRLLFAAIDAQLTDEEISALVAFYDGPDYPRLDAFMHQFVDSPNLPPADERAWAEQVMARPELQKFGRLVIQVGHENARSPEVESVVRQCGDAALEELRAAELVE